MVRLSATTLKAADDARDQIKHPDDRNEQQGKAQCCPIHSAGHYKPAIVFLRQPLPHEFQPLARNGLFMPFRLSSSQSQAGNDRHGNIHAAANHDEPRPGDIGWLTKPFFEDEAFNASVLAKIKLGRIGKVEDLMGAIVFLASDASALMTGTSVVIDGGWTAD